MLGLDDRIAALSGGGGLALVVLTGILLGLRHATDPDHLAAVTTLVASGRGRASRDAGRLGLAWGAGHGLTLVAFGLPVVLLHGLLSEPAQRLAESAVGLVIVALAIRLIVRWRRGWYGSGAEGAEAPHAHRRGSRTAAGAFGIGLLHGIGGSAGVGVLLVASIASKPLAVLALALLAVATALAMWLVTTGYGRTLVSRPVAGALPVVAPALGVASLGFGLWYVAAAWNAAWYPF